MSLKTLYNDFYGDETRWWVGVVQSTDDPIEQGRLRVRIYGIHSASEADIPNIALPWAQVVAPVTQGGTSGINGTPVGIQAYAQVFGIFLDGKHSQLPLVLGSIPKVDGKNPAHGQHSGATATGAQGNGLRGPGYTTKPTPAVNLGGQGTTPSYITSKVLVGGTNTEKVYNYFEQHFQLDGRSNSKELAAGFTGNFITESNCNPFIENGIGAVGIAQWLGERRTALQHYARERGLSLSRTTLSNGKSGIHQVPDLGVQLDFVIHELDNLTWLRFDDWVSACTTAQKAADRIEAYYEISEFSVAFRKDVPGKQRWKFASFYDRFHSGRDDVGAYKKRLTDAQATYNTFAINSKESASQ